MKITPMLFLICLLDQVYSKGMGNLKASEDMSEQRQGNYSTNDGVDVNSTSNIETTKPVKRPLDISKGNNGLAVRSKSFSENIFSTDTNSQHNNNYYAAINFYAAPSSALR